MIQHIRSLLFKLRPVGASPSLMRRQVKQTKDESDPRISAVQLAA